MCVDLFFLCVAFSFWGLVAFVFLSRQGAQDGDVVLAYIRLPVALACCSLLGRLLFQEF